jgi:hypothetical protein
MMETIKIDYEKLISDILADEHMALSSKIIKLWAIAQLNYRMPIGDKSWEAIRDLTNADVSNALAFLTGFSMGMGINGFNEEKLKNFL